jgi:hypothetical protein
MSKKRTIPSITPEELETLVRRVVREEIRRVLQRPVRSILDDWKQEGPEDPEGDALLLREALGGLREYEDKPDAWMSWDDFEAELDRAEAAGELPD